MYEYTIFRQQQDIRRGITGQCFAQIRAEYFHFAVIGTSENLDVVSSGVRGGVASQVDGIPEVRRSVGYMIAGVSHLSGDRNHGRIFKIKPTEHANGVKRL